MSEHLDLNFPDTGTAIYPSDKLAENEKRLLEITDIDERLEYYNQHICSLSYHYPPEGLQSFGQYYFDSGYGKIVFKPATFNSEDFELFLKIRKKEIQRIELLLAEKETYYDKLKCFIEQKAGQHRTFDLQVYSNSYLKSLLNGNAAYNEKEEKRVLINLEPKNTDDTKSHNKYLYDYVNRLIIEPKTFHWLIEEKYRGFLSSHALEQFVAQIDRSFNQESTITNKIREIENKFSLGQLNYSERLYPYKIDDLLTWQSALFNAFYHGFSYDYSKRRLTLTDTKALIHVEQVFQFYKEVIEIKKGKAYNHQNKQVGNTNTEETKLNDLTDFHKIWQQRGLDLYNRINSDLATIAQTFNKRINQKSADLKELKELKADLKEQIKHLKDDLRKTTAKIPDAANFLNSFEVIKGNQTFVVNKDLEQKIDERYRNTIDSLLDGLDIVQDRIADKEDGATIRQKVETENFEPANPISFGLTDRLAKIEQAMQTKVSKWKQREALIECAAFIELLFDNGYFEKKENRIKTCNEFALFRYGISIKNSLSGKAKSARAKHKTLLKKHFAMV